MAKRHADAIAIQLGAVNPIAIVKALDRAIDEIRRDPNAGTAGITEDPAIKLMVHQLAFICGVHGGVKDFSRKPNYTECAAACKVASKVMPKPELGDEGHVPEDNG